MRVKGTLVLDYVRIIRANRGQDWSKYLTPEDWQIIDSQVLSSQWYPYDSFRRIAFAVFKVIAKGNLKTAETFGRFTVKNMLGVYKNILVPGDPAASMDKLARLRRTFFEGEMDTKILEHGKGWLRYEIIVFAQEEDNERIEAFCHQAAGNLIEITEQSGGKNIKADISLKSTGGEIKVSWE
ncbi:MAG TPA: hypothetical protein VM658_18955 [bacterium]|nr:hypothetical protein [bacterium]